MITTNDIKAIRRDLLDLAYCLYGIDLGGYSPSFIDRRLELLASKKGMKNVFSLKHELINNKSFAIEMEASLSVNITEMFRDPLFFKSLATLLKESFSSEEEIKIWHTGCSAGKEVYSLAILLKEINLLANSTLHGTDISPYMIELSNKGIIDTELIKKYSLSYRTAGGTKSLKEYFTISLSHSQVINEIRKRISFSVHNLLKDSSFGNFKVIVCRNMFIYYDMFTQEKLLQNILNALEPNGILCMGKMESLQYLPGSEQLRCVNTEFNIYKKIS